MAITSSLEEPLAVIDRLILREDFDGNGTVDFGDFLMFVSAFGNRG